MMRAKRAKPLPFGFRFANAAMGPYVWSPRLAMTAPMARAFLFVLDSFGIGGAADAERLAVGVCQQGEPRNRIARTRLGDDTYAERSDLVAPVSARGVRQGQQRRRSRQCLPTRSDGEIRWSHRSMPLPVLPKTRRILRGYVRRACPTP